MLCILVVAAYDSAHETLCRAPACHHFHFIDFGSGMDSVAWAVARWHRARRQHSFILAGLIASRVANRDRRGLFISSGLPRSRLCPQPSRSGGVCLCRQSCRWRSRLAAKIPSHISEEPVRSENGERSKRDAARNWHTPVHVWRDRGADLVGHRNRSPVVAAGLFEID